MENSVLNKLQLYKGKWFSDLVDETMLSNALQIEPYKVAQVVSYIFGTKDDGYASSLDFITGGLGNKLVIDRPEFEWEIFIEMDRAVTIRRAEWNGQAIVDPNDPMMTPGLNITPIKLWLTDKWFGPGAILEMDDNRFRIRVDGAPYQDGNDWVYTCYVANGQPNMYIPAEYLVPGKQVSRGGSAYEEYSEEGDILVYQTGFKMRNQLTISRLNWDITGSAYSTVLAVGLKDSNGKTTYLWAPYQLWLGTREWMKRIERQMVFGQYTKTPYGTEELPGTNGRPVRQGAGILEQISPSNHRFYTRLTADLIEDFLFDLSYNVLGTNERKFIAFTGEMGLREFDRVIKEKMGAMPLIDTKFVTGSGHEMSFGGQFKTYLMSNGIVLTVKHMPFFDDIVHNRKLHPITLKPLMSYMFMILDLGRRDGESNVVKVVRKDREFVQWHTGGSVGPNGYANSINTVRSNGKDGYTVFFLGEYGIMIRDPRACAILECDAE